MEIDTVSAEIIKPSSPTPSESRDFKLSFFDERIPHAYVPLILYYSCNESQNIKEGEISSCLKKSLSDALVPFYPLAGRTDGQSSVKCNDKGVLYMEAKVDGEISDIIECPEIKVLDRLIPHKSKGSVVTDAEELLAIQVSLFTCGGISIGISISHRVADGFSLCSFIKGWASMACGKSESVHPVFNSSSLFPPRNTPDFKPNVRSLAIQPPAIHLASKRFVFSEPVINALKSEVIDKSSIANPTRVEVVSAFIWKACIVARGIEKLGKSMAFYPVNLRGRVPSLTEDSFGNLFQMTSAVNFDETNWVHLVEKLRAAFGKISSDHINKLLGENGSEVAKNNFMQVNQSLGQGDCEVFRFNSYCRFPLYETDFGWGKPAWVSSGFSNRNSTLLLDSKSSGGIEAWIVMTEDDLKKLEEEMNVKLSRLR